MEHDGAGVPHDDEKLAFGDPGLDMSVRPHWTRRKCSRGLLVCGVFLQV